MFTSVFIDNETFSVPARATNYFTGWVLGWTCSIYSDILLILPLRNFYGLKSPRFGLVFRSQSQMFGALLFENEATDQKW